MVVRQRAGGCYMLSPYLGDVSTMLLFAPSLLVPDMQNVSADNTGSQNEQPTPRPRRNDSTVPHSHCRHRHRRHVRSTGRRSLGKPPASIMDAHHQLYLLGNRNAFIVGDPDSVFPSHDGPQAPAARGDSFAITSDRTS